jgi:DNA-binding beta-propeller fold protein YncE
MNNYRFGLFGLVSLLTAVAGAQAASPLKAIQTIALPEVTSGSFDHLGIDGKRGRLFVTSSGSKAILVIDLASGKVVHQIASITKPHAVLYRSDQDRIYVTDGGTGELKTFDGTDYHAGPAIKLQVDADSIGFDRATQTVYVDNGGRDAGSAASVLSFIDTAKLTKPAMKIVTSSRCPPPTRLGKRKSVYRWPALSHFLGRRCFAKR